MRSWERLEADQVLLLTKNFTKGRGKQIDRVVIHHNAGVNTVESLWRLWEFSRAASAHYQVCSDGWIGQLVWDGDTAHHAANWDINQRSIGIEVSNSAGANQNWPITVKALEETSHLIAAVCVYYKLGRPQWNRNVFGHSTYAATSCPHHMAAGGKYHNVLMSRAVYWYEQMTAASTPKNGALTMSEIEGIKRHVDATVARERAALYRDLTAFIKGWTQPIIDDVKTVRGQLTGSRDDVYVNGRLDVEASYPGWSQLDDKTLVDAVAVLAGDLRAVKDQVSAAVPSLINPGVAITPRNLLRLIDATVWRMERVLESEDGAKEIIAAAIEADRAPKGEEQ